MSRKTAQKRIEYFAGELFTDTKVYRAEYVEKLERELKEYKLAFHMAVNTPKGIVPKCGDHLYEQDFLEKGTE